MTCWMGTVAVPAAPSSVYTKWQVYVTGNATSWPSEFEVASLSRIKLSETHGGADVTGSAISKTVNQLYAGAVDNLFDNNTGTYCEFGNPSGSWPVYCTIEFTDGIDITELIMSARSDSHNTWAPKNFKVRKYNSTTLSWEDAYTATGITWALGETKTFQW